MIEINPVDAFALNDTGGPAVAAMLVRLSRGVTSTPVDDLSFVRVVRVKFRCHHRFGATFLFREERPTSAPPASWSPQRRILPLTDFFN
jgi:hypothetical protein